MKLEEALRVLGLDEVPESLEDLRSVYHMKTIEAHPDKGGDVEAFVRIVQAAGRVREAVNCVCEECGGTGVVEKGVGFRKLRSRCTKCRGSE
jgi:hypothetical protein